MTRRRAVSPLVAALAVGVSATALGWLATRQRPGRAVYERVREGMTRAEVEATAGGRPGDYRSDPRVWVGPGSLADCLYDSWVCDDAQLQVQFDDRQVARSVVVRGTWKPFGGESGWRDHWDRVRFRLGLLPRQLGGYATPDVLVAMTGG